jgi:hypothetical protein
VLGEAAPRWLDDRAVAARLVRPDGDVRVVGDWPEAAAPRLTVDAERPPTDRRDAVTEMAS